MLFFDKFHCVFYLYLKSIRCRYRKLISKFVDDESGLHHGYVVVVDYKKLNLCLVDNHLVHFLAFAVNIIGLRGFWLNTISCGDIPNFVVIWELFDGGNNFTSADHSVYWVSFPLMIHLRYSCNERFIPSTNPFVQGA